MKAPKIGYQDGGKTKKQLDYSKSKKVEKTPEQLISEGYKEEKKDGKTYYVKQGQSDTPKSETPRRVYPAPPKKSSTVGSGKPQLPRRTPPTTLPPTEKDFQDIVYIEDKVPPLVGVNTDIEAKGEEKRTALGTNAYMISYPDTKGGGGMSKATEVIFNNDPTIGKIGDQIIYDPVTGKPTFTGKSQKDFTSQNMGSIRLISNDVNKNSVDYQLSNSKNPVANIGDKMQETTAQGLNAPVIDKTEQGINTGLLDINTLPTTELKKRNAEIPVTSPKFKSGGKIMKAPKGIKVKGYLLGGEVEQEREEGYSRANPEQDRATAQLDANGNPILSNNTLPLSTGTEFKTQGDAPLSTTPTTALDDKSQPKQKTGSGFGSKLGSSLGWMQYANMAKEGALATVKKDTITDPTTGKDATGYKDFKGQATQVWATPTHEKIIDEAKKGNYGQALLSSAPLLGNALAYSKMRKGNEKYNQALENIETQKKNEGAQTALGNALAARENGETGYSAVNPYRRNASIDDKKVKTKESVLTRFGDALNFANGGKIVGAGTPKSDSINAKIEDGSFVVPAENAKEAEIIRKVVLKKAPKMKANLKQAGGENVKLSNGEHLFSPEETEKLEALGIDLDELSPNADNGNSFAGGGKTGNDSDYPKELDNKFDSLRQKTEEDLRKAFPDKEIKVVYKGKERSLADQKKQFDKGSSTTKFGLHGIGAARDFNIIINGRVLGNNKEDHKIYQDYLWKNAEKSGLYHLKKDEFGGTDPYHIGLVEEKGDGTAFKKLVEMYPEITKTKQFQNSLKELRDIKAKNPNDTTYDSFLNSVKDVKPEVKKEDSYTDDLSTIFKNNKLNTKTEDKFSTDSEKQKIESEKLSREKAISEKKASDKKLSDKFAQEREVLKNKEQKEKYKKAWEEDFKAKENKYNALKDSYKTFTSQSETELKQPKRYGLDPTVTPEGELKKKEKLLNLVSKAEKEYNDAKKLHEAAQNESNWNPDGTAKLNSNKGDVINGINNTAVASLKAPKGIKITNTPTPETQSQTEATVKQGENTTNVNDNESNYVNTWDRALIDKYKTPEAKTEATTTVDPNLAKYNKDLADAEARTTTPTSIGRSKWTSNLSGLGNYLGSAVEVGASLAQIKLGRDALNKAGVRPVGEIDPSFQANVDRAHAQSKYGFTAEQNALINQENQNATNAARFAARNYSGGSGGNAFNMERSAINEGWGRGLQAKIANTNLMLDKQQLDNQLSLQKAGMSRQLFEDKMDAFQQNQQAGALLKQTGWKNLIGATRYASALNSINQQNQLGQ